MTEKGEIIKRLINNCEEIITAEELQTILASGNKLTHYIGFEISGYVHLGTGLMSALVMKDLTDLGVKCTVWLADWHSAINNKLDGTRQTAAVIGQGYFTEAIKASFAAVGGDVNQLEFRLSSEWYNRDPERYWDLVREIGSHTTLARVLRSVDIMGKQTGDDIAWSRTMYPIMQAADIFYQDLDIMHAGMDQRKIHVVVRDVAKKLRPNSEKPIAIHHPLLPSLSGSATGDNKMSKSDPVSAVFVHDTPEVIKDKIRQSFAAPKDVANNPVLNWTRHLLFWNRSEPFSVKREEKHGGNLEFETYEDLEKAYAAGDLHPMDLKVSVARELTTLLAPVREHFAKPEIAAMKADLDEVLARRNG